MNIELTIYIYCTHLLYTYTTVLYIGYISTLENIRVLNIQRKKQLINMYNVYNEHRTDITLTVHIYCIHKHVQCMYPHLSVWSCLFSISISSKPTCTCNRTLKQAVGTHRNIHSAYQRNYLPGFRSFQQTRTFRSRALRVRVSRFQTPYYMYMYMEWVRSSLHVHVHVYTNTYPPPINWSLVYS